MCLDRKLEEVTNKRAAASVERRPRKISKPRLPRRITNTCKINLNKFWNELEDFYSGTTSTSVLPAWNETGKEELENSNNENIEKENSRLSAMEVTSEEPAFQASGRLERYVLLLPSTPSTPLSPSTPLLPPTPSSSQSSSSSVFLFPPTQY
eukprot:GFUD01012832.1.p1 GENE.GFUD01012832.1~~GFUD01012832.1.p1  ORF type:complete len:152 (-),score=37.32 GFUD01012832.1:163-618(-)